MPRPGERCRYPAWVTNTKMDLESLDILKRLPATPDLQLWKTASPTADEFVSFLDAIGCSDCVDDEFPILLPHILDIVENIPTESRADYIHYVGFYFIKAIEHFDHLPNNQILTKCIPRMKKLAIGNMDQADNANHLNLSILAACYGEADLGIYISRYYDEN